MCIWTITIAWKCCWCAARRGVIRKIADELITAKGVKHGKLTVTTTGKDLPS